MSGTSNAPHYNPTGNEGRSEEPADDDHNPVSLVLTMGGIIVVVAMG